MGGDDKENPNRNAGSRPHSWSSAMFEADSITRLLGGLKDGENEMIQRLFDRYFERLVRLAGARMPRHRRRELDEEDIALSAFHSFCDRAARGQFPQLADRTDLWRVLAMLTTRKLYGTLRHQSRQKRGGGQVVGESAVERLGTGGLDQILCREPTPGDAAAFADDCERLFNRLADPVLKTIALRKLEGFSSEEIAAELKVSVRTVDRKLELIRGIWEEEAS
jgi:DNA-directed RNA polymerase specialized sigma24 family protein